MSETSTPSTIPALGPQALTELDVKDVVALSDSVLLRISNDISDGFLVSGYGEDVYIRACRNVSGTGKPQALLIGTRHKERALVGFIFGYDAAYGRSFMGGSTETAIDDYLGAKTDYYILKQIAVAPGWRRGGVGVALARAFIERVPLEQSVFTTIVTEPKNPSSELFHARLGFTPVLVSRSSGAGGASYPSRIWRRAPAAPLCG